MRRIWWLGLALVWGCGGGGGEHASSVEGFAAKGNLSDATVEVWSAGDNGAPQLLLGTTTTGANGTFSLSVSAYDGWTIVKVFGGSYVDEATGATSTIPAATPLLGVALASSMPSPYAVTPLTTMLTTLAQEEARDPGVSFGDAVDNAALKIGVMFGVANAHTTVPADLTAGPVATGPAAQYGAILAGYSVCALDQGVTGGEMTYGAAKDAKDGSFDGLEFLDTVHLSLSVDLTPNFLTLLGSFTANWLDTSAHNASGLTSADLPGLSALAAAADMVPSGPRVQAVWNGHSPLAGGNEVTVRGWGFGAAPEVFVGTTQVTPASSSDTEITFDTPSFSVAGSYDLRVRADFGLSYLSKGALRYYDQNAAPTATGFEPKDGPICGGTPVRITGTNLDPATRVFFGTDEATVVSGTPPREIVAISPRVTDAGTSSLRVQNGAGKSFTLSGSYDYRKKDVGRAFDQSDLSGDYTALFEKWDFAGSAFRLSAGTTKWHLDGLGQGTFTRQETAMTSAGPTDTTTTGSAFATAEGQNGQVLTIDGGSNATNLYVFTIHPGGRAMSGLTAGGNVYVYKHGSGVSASTLDGRYGVAGSYVNFTPKLTFATGAGTMEFDGKGGGGVNMKIFERDGEGTGYRQSTLILPLLYDVTGDGALTITLDPDSAIPWNLAGRVTSDGALAGFSYAGTGGWQGRAAYFTAIKLDPDVAPEDFRGEYAGGYLGQETFDDLGTFRPKVSSYLSNRLLETSGLTSRYFGTSDGSTQTPGPKDVLLGAGAVEARFAGQRGRLEYGNGAVGGWFSPKLGLSLSVGYIGETVQTTSFDNRIEFGAGVRFDTRFTKHSIDGIHNLLYWTSQWQGPGTPVTGDESNETGIGSVTFNPQKPLTIGGQDFSGFGGFDGLALSSKFVTRSGLSASTTFGAPPDPKATFAYGFLNDRFRYLIAERDPMGPLGSFSPGFVKGTGALSPTGALGGFASTANDDRTSFTAFVPRNDWTIGTSYRFGSTLYDFGAGGATLGRIERGTFDVSGPSVTQNYLQRLFTEGAGSTTSSGMHSGTFTKNPNFTADFALDGHVYGGLAVGNADLFLLTDFSDNHQTGIQVFVKDALSKPPLFDYGMTSLQKIFLDAMLPAQTSLHLLTGTYTPTRNLISLVALDENRANDMPGTSLGRQFNNGTASANATGGFTFNFGNTAFNGAITPDGCFGFGMPGPDDQAPTAMQIAIKMSF